MEKILKLFRENMIIVFCVFILIGLGAWTHSKNTQPKPVAIKSESIQKKSESPKKEQNKLLMVDIQGAVKSPGVYQFKDGAIVQEVIKIAGGLTENADVKQINQAQKVTDQMQIIVPQIDEPSGNISASTKATDKKVNINTAKVEDFQSVTGIGPKKAQKIIEFREQNGTFKELKDLTKVSGIGDKTLESLKDQLTV